VPGCQGTLVHKVQRAVEWQALGEGADLAAVQRLQRGHHTHCGHHRGRAAQVDPRLTVLGFSA
jgi:hypothetical protein